MDYFSPQLYWPVNRYAQSFPVLLGWWAGENKMNRHLWPGINIGNDSTDKNLDEIINEIMIDRGIQPLSKGVVHWSISSLIRNPRMADTLLRSVYKKEALVPASPWLGNKLPPVPEVTTEVQGANRKISWSDPDQKSIFRWVVYYQYGNGWNYRILNRYELSLEISQTLQLGKTVLPLKKIAVSAVDRLGNESEKRIIEIVQ
jgi:hypothetical protein